MRGRLIAAAVLAALTIAPALLAAAQQTGTGTVTLSLGIYTEINVRDSTITIQFTPQDSNVIAWFAFNANDFLQANEGASNTNVTLSVTGYTIDAKPRAYPTSFSDPRLYFMLDKTATTMPTGLYFTSTIQAPQPTTTPQTISIPASLDVNGDGTPESCVDTTTNAPNLVFTAQTDLREIALYYDSTSGSVSKPSVAEYINLAVITCTDAANIPYTVVLGKTSTNPDDFNYTDSAGALYNADFVVYGALTPYAEHNVLSLTFTTTPTPLTEYFIVLQADTTVGVVLAPAELLSYDGAANDVQIFGLVELPVGAPTGEYRFTVNLAVEAAST